MHIDAPKIFEYKLKVQHKIIKIVSRKRVVIFQNGDFVESLFFTGY